jgi:intracellular septation protein A
MTAPSPGLTLWTYRRAFELDGRPACVTIKSGMRGMVSALSLDGMDLAYDFTPASGADAARTHLLSVKLPDGRALAVEAGYISWTNVAIAAKLDGVLIHESHPGTPVQMPKSVARMVTQTTADGRPATDMGKLTANRVPIAVDIATGLLFFVVAKFAGLQTAALVGAGVGLALVVVQRFIKTDILGGMVMFGIIMLLLSAGFAWAFQDDEIIKMRSTIIGLVGATAFLADGALGGRWLGQGMSRYIAYVDIRPARLSIGMGMVGLVMAALNVFVVRMFSTDAWLFYTTFLDTFISMAMLFYAVQWARRGPAGA